MTDTEETTTKTNVPCPVCSQIGSKDRCRNKLSNDSTPRLGRIEDLVFCESCRSSIPGQTMLALSSRKRRKMNSTDAWDVLLGGVDHDGDSD